MPSIKVKHRKHHNARSAYSVHHRIEFSISTPEHEGGPGSYSCDQIERHVDVLAVKRNIYLVSQDFKDVLLATVYRALKCKNIELVNKILDLRFNQLL